MSIQAISEELREIEASTITTDFKLIGSTFSNQSRMLYIQNLTDKELRFSFDGTTENFVLPAYGYKSYDIQANAEPNSRFFMKDTYGVYVKYKAPVTAPTAGGHVYIDTIIGA